MASLERVVLTSESVFATVAHALSTERQEVMGLLFGRWDGAAVEVESVMPLPRLDKRSDRVEVTGPQLAEAAQVAESLGLRVVGWYHSHPHITVQASHVDVRTQAQYQALDGRFFGLICACFQGADGAGAAAPLHGLAAPSRAAKESEIPNFKGSYLGRRALPRGGRRRGQAGLGGGATRGAYADAIFHKAAALLAADALHPLIHVAAASKANLAARLDAAKAARSKLFARLEDDSAG
ncbi:metallopeptidase [Aureococcus anophagefferens]|nr:metallopeptidase [Aureococcus anophagefferens]